MNDVTATRIMEALEQLVRVEQERNDLVRADHEARKEYVEQERADAAARWSELKREVAAEPDA